MHATKDAPIASADEDAEIESLQSEIDAAAGWIPLIMGEMSRVVVGQQYLIRRLLIGLLSNGHVLLEGVPGLAKTTTVQALARCLHAAFGRIQFTPDLLPSDIIGTLIYDPGEHKYLTRKGPVFVNLLLADEINRAPAKVQSALLEAMQERQVTLGEETHPLPSPFLVLATQNPVEQEGTYPLPEAQLDRFMLKVEVNYGTEEEEIAILEKLSSSLVTHQTNPVMELEALLKLRKLADRIYVDDNVKRYIVSLVMATREPDRAPEKMRGYIRFGASPRATINFVRAAKAHAFLEGRAHVTPHDVRSIAYDIMGHRILRTYEAEADNVSTRDLVSWIVDHIPVP